MSKLATEEMTACPSCGELTFNTGDCFHCLAIAQSKAVEPAPIDMLIFCPDCGMQHVDGADQHPPILGESRWDNPPHKSHLCHQCGLIFRIADVPTNGVSGIKTRGKADTWPACREAANA